jgi:hypothetical protein
VKRLNLRSQSWQIIRSFVKWGNEFLELLIDPGASNIVGLKKLPEHTVWPKTDKMGNRIPGYEQRPEQMPTGSAAISFEEWEIVHFAFGAIDGYLGTPLLKKARRNWKRLNLAEDFTAAARIMRAFMKIVHRVPVNSDWSVEQQQQAIESYKKMMKERKLFDQDAGTVTLDQNPDTVFTDYFIPDDGSGRGNVDMLDPENSQLQNIKDVEHFQDRLITATTVPKRYYPFEGSVPKLSEGGGQAEDKNFACTLMFCQMIFKQGISLIFDRQLILKGINPIDVRYVIRMGEINTTDQLREAQTEMALANTMKIILANYPEMADNIEVMLREYTRMSDASKEKVRGVEIKPREYTPAIPGRNGGNMPDDRSSVPGMGNPDARTKI